MRRFSFHRRGEVYYVQLLNPVTGRYGTAKSTGCRDPEEARIVAARWLTEGVPVGRKHSRRPPAEAWTREAILAAIRGEGFTADDARAVLESLRARGLVEGFTLRGSPAAERAVDFLRRFWSEEASPYVREERARGKALTLRHVREMGRLVERYWTEVLGGRLLGEVGRQDVRDALAAFSARGLAAGTIAKALQALATATKWAHAEGILPANPAEGVRRIIGRAKERGILADEELAALASHPDLWRDERARVAFLVAATTGLRRGEVAALRLEDVAEDRLHVRHAWSDDDGLTVPKNKQAREAALLAEVRAEILSLAAGNPHGRGAEGFVFFGAEPDRPLDPNILSRGFDLALEALELGERAGTATEEERQAAHQAVKARGLSFHSLRHGFARRMADRLDTERAMRATGHLSAAMLAHYSDHKTAEDFAKVRAAAADAFARIVPFRRPEADAPEATPGKRPAANGGRA